MRTPNLFMDEIGPSCRDLGQRGHQGKTFSLRCSLGSIRVQQILSATILVVNFSLENLEGSGAVAKATFPFES